ncbi:MAG: branched-chain amino acid ABC transporter permease [Eubacteriales bacterium]
MYITWDTIITAGSVVGAIISMLVVVLKVHKWYLRQQKQNEEIARMKKENKLICEGLSACLDGLSQLGANHTVPVVKKKLDDHLNEVAHK